MSLRNKRIVLCITGSIAAQKAEALVSGIRAEGGEVRVAITEAAQNFVSVSSLRALSGNPVVTDWFDDSKDGMEHIHLARWGDAVVIAPLSANTLAKMAHGYADNVVSSLYLVADDIHVAVAPAMNCSMWAHTATQENINTLRERGVLVWGPNEGELACGEVGVGRMSEPTELLADLNALFAKHESGESTESAVRILVTAGPTVEAIDPVRYVSNHSSGKMGFAMARAAALRGDKVTVISGPTALETPDGVAHRIKRVNVTNTKQMYDEVMKRVADTDIFIACAAVADYRCAEPHTQKIKKQDRTINVRMERTEDILLAVATSAHRPFCVGFAAETEASAVNARAKMMAKNLDMVVANEVGEGHPYGFGGDDNKVEVFWRDGGETQLGPMSKTKLAESVMEQVWRLYETHTGFQKSSAQSKKTENN